ncbi:SAM-dependent methyltransferase [Sphingosinicella terrae]|uniref:SAM-dependent methyltransferase n=1 Tax=Sphingosinicella terrae TaxID=2172047 RepID=UPI000E0D7F9E|nr:methyltransferase domain-containing protein [Sphingosinicella terrae]
MVDDRREILGAGAGWGPWVPRLAAAGLTLLIGLSLLTGISCLSLNQTQCSISSLLNGREDLDVPYAGTRPAVVSRMLEMAAVQPGDQVIDLGTGDGRILIAAARERGARGIGVDLDPALIDAARGAARQSGVADRVEFRVENLFETTLSQADVVTMFLLPEVNLRLRPRLLGELRPGARIVSHAFDMGEWRPDETARVGGAWVYRWTVPARAAGTWRFVGEDGREGVLRLDQHFQAVSGDLQTEGAAPVLVTGRLEGERIALEIGAGDGEPRLAGIVRDGRIVPVDPAMRWRAER